MVYSYHHACGVYSSIVIMLCICSLFSTNTTLNTTDSIDQTKATSIVGSNPPKGTDKPIPDTGEKLLILLMPVLLNFIKLDELC